MSLFKKRETPIDTWDLTDLDKKGLLKAHQKESEVVSQSPGVIDFTSASPSPSTSVSSAPSAPASEGGFFGFLDNPSPASSSSSFSAPTPSFPSSPGLSDSNLEIQGLKSKIDDLEFKINNLIDKLEGVHSRLLEFERNAVR